MVSCRKVFSFVWFLYRHLHRIWHTKQLKWRNSVCEIINTFKVERGRVHICVLSVILLLCRNTREHIWNPEPLPEEHPPSLYFIYFNRLRARLFWRILCKCDPLSTFFVWQGWGARRIAGLVSNSTSWIIWTKYSLGTITKRIDTLKAKQTFLKVMSAANSKCEACVVLPSPPSKPTNCLHKILGILSQITLLEAIIRPYSPAARCECCLLRAHV